MIVERQMPGAVVASHGTKKIRTPLPFFLAFKEIWRNKGRYLLISLVIALITTLVLFIAGLAEGLGAGNKEYLEKLNAEVVLFQENVDLSIPSSQLDRSRLNDVLRVEGVKDVGSISFSNASIPFANDQEPLKISLIGVEPGKPGEPPALQGSSLQGKRDNEAIVDRNVSLRTGLQAGDRFTIKSVQGTEEKFYTLKVAGVSDGRQYSIQPSVFVPYVTWDDIKPKSTVANGQPEQIFNLMAVKLNDPADFELVVKRIEDQVSQVEAVDRKTAYESTPGYGPQQSTLNTQRIFTLLIGVLVVGGFFQIQTLQKVSQVGMLKAIGVSNIAIVITFLLQIVTITLLGVAIGGLGTWLLSLAFPPAVPIVFTPASIITAITFLLLIGPLGGLVSIRILLNVEPLTALGLGN